MSDWVLANQSYLEYYSERPLIVSGSGRVPMKSTDQTTCENKKKELRTLKVRELKAVIGGCPEIIVQGATPNPPPTH